MSRTDSDVRRLTSHLSEQTDRLSGIAMDTIYAVTYKLSQWQRNAPWFIQVTPGHGEMPQRSQHVKKSHAHKQGDGDHNFASTPIHSHCYSDVNQRLRHQV